MKKSTVYTSEEGETSPIWCGWPQRLKRGRAAAPASVEVTEYVVRTACLFRHILGGKLRPSRCGNGPGHFAMSVRPKDPQKVWSYPHRDDGVVWHGDFSYLRGGQIEPPIFQPSG